MPSKLAKQAAGTYIEDSIANLTGLRLWLSQQCRAGSLAAPVKAFCEAQEEMVDQSLVVVETIASDVLQCRIPCSCYDHESSGTFPTEVRFSIEPATGQCRRVLAD